MIVDQLPLSRAVVDRAAERRTDGLAAVLAHPATRVLLVDDGAVVTERDGGLALLTPAAAAAYVAEPSAASTAELPSAVPAAEPPAPSTTEPSAAAAVVPEDAAAATRGATGRTAPPTDADDEAWLLLGQDEDGAAYVARRVLGRRETPRAGAAADALVHPRTGSGPGRRPASALPDGAAWSSLRTVGATLSARDAGLATTAVALDAWHARHPRCPRCGAPTRPVQAGWVRACVEDGSEHYPRTDPAVIMAVVDDQDRLLLGHATAWAAGRWSTLAGFVEPGESLESAVRREVREETGVVVGDVEYRGSQPWPFPASLMVAFRARALSTQVLVDGVELAAADWFTRGRLRAAVASGEVVPPGPVSIARALVEDWLGDRLPEPPR